MESPSETVLQYSRHVDRGEWEKAAALYTDEVIEFSGRISPHDDPEPMTVERYLESDPTMPRSVAEYLAERAARAYETKPERRTPEAGFARDLASMSAVQSRLLI